MKEVVSHVIGIHFGLSLFLVLLVCNLQPLSRVSFFPISSCRPFRQIRTSLLAALFKASYSFEGPSVIDIFNSLLEQIRTSIVSEKDRPEEEENNDEKVYQETLIHALGEYTSHLPDYQKIEAMTFILNKVLRFF